MVALVSQPELQEASVKTLEILESIPKQGSEWYIEDYQSKNMGHVARTLLQPVIKHAALADELLLQLTRFTCEYDQPDSKMAIVYWKLLLIAVNCIQPIVTEVGDYLKLHLKRASILDENMPRENMRLFEAKHAQTCLKIYRKSSNVEPRKFVPSKDEIEAVAVCLSLNASQ